MKVWVTNYALTLGILERDMQLHVADNGARYVEGDGLFLRLGREAFESHSDAIDAAEDIRDRKIKSVRKQLARLLAMRFDAGIAGAPE